ncbi:uncharacterized protein LOC108858932 isoform X2 [Raphanus sativus]|uniref:Uncharacterized protein LOC108858932 isoform X2 n=1 Tax=Raphanus sativus TaxID=3726 RepID=A0A9W3BTK9_RAPSA|nr:uncharacterized protein LOC108858932 isoform X2 [Raphanus sativus]
MMEAKVRRAVWWALCIFFLTYFLAHTSKSMWMNLPVAVLILCGLRILLNQNEFRRKVMPAPRQRHLPYPGRKQLSLNDARLSTTPPPPSWKNKINSQVVENAINDFVGTIVDKFVKKLWYSGITPDKDFPELIRGMIMNAVVEISVRVKEINIFGLIRDIVDLMGDHLESFRRNQAAIGITDVMKTLSSEDIDKKLKGHLMNSKELYPALVSAESEYKILQEIVTGILSVVLRPREFQCPFVQTIARELLACLVFQRLVNIASPHISYNEDIELLEESTQGEDDIVSEANGWHSDNELDSKHVPPRVVRYLGEPEKGLSDSQHADPSTSLVHIPANMPPEWIPPNVIELILNLVDKMFQLKRGGWFRRKLFSGLKKMLLAMENPVDDLLLWGICWLRNEDTVAHGIRLATDNLRRHGEKALDQAGPTSFEQQLQYGARKIKEFLFNKAPKALVGFVWNNLHRTCASDIFYFTKSNVCVKQLAFAILELLLGKVLPELEDTLRDIRKNPPRMVDHSNNEGSL